MNKENLRIIIDEAKELSKSAFTDFVTKEFDVNADYFNYLWDVPIVRKEDLDKILLSGIESSIKLKIEEIIQEQLGKSEAVFWEFKMIFEQFKDNFDGKDYDEIFVKEYYAVIIYSEEKLFELYDEIYNDYLYVKTRDEIVRIFLKNVAKIFTHERVHQNSNRLINSEIYINGCELLDYRSEEEYMFYLNQNEVYVDTIALIIHYYGNFKTIEDCLEKIIKLRNGHSRYQGFDDTLILALFVIFQEELINWILFRAHDDNSYNNIIETKINEIFQKQIIMNETAVINLLGNYFNKIKNEFDILSRTKKVQLLRELVIRNISI